MSKAGGASRQTVVAVQGRVVKTRLRAQKTLIWRIWERLLEIEFVDRSVALAGKAFVSFFPLIIVVAAFMPAGVRSSIFSTLTHRLGLTGAALGDAKHAFASAEDVRKATGILGLILTFFFTSSFVTALQRVYLQAWRRPPGRPLSAYVRGPVWLVFVLVYMAVVGGARKVLPGGVATVFVVIVAVALAVAMWWLTAWLLLMGQVRLRVLLPSGLITGIAMSGFALSANVWMPSSVASNQKQFGFFGVALSLVTWFSGAAMCIMAGACAGPVLAQDTGKMGRIARFGAESLLVDGAPAFLPAPTRALTIADAFTPIDDAGGANATVEAFPPTGAVSPEETQTPKGLDVRWPR